MLLVCVTTPSLTELRVDKRQNANDDERGAAIMPQCLVVSSDIAWREVFAEDSSR